MTSLLAILTGIPLPQHPNHSPKRSTAASTLPNRQEVNGLRKLKHINMTTLSPIDVDAVMRGKLNRRHTFSNAPRGSRYTKNTQQHSLTLWEKKSYLRIYYWCSRLGLTSRYFHHLGLTISMICRPRRTWLRMDKYWRYCMTQQLEKTDEKLLNNIKR